ncbi:ABC transporter permease [Microlunatus sp. GCM10028923]|uniref:ABC transporter permease n=1 Tax=Microlunatus sp. GCM10028923 TaxID=3273400 RepID=UPI00361AAF48
MTLSPRLDFVRRRLIRLVISVVVVITASFALIQLVPGDPIRAALGVSAPAELVEARRQQLGLDQPLPVQYLDYLTGLFRGDFGTSLVSQIPVGSIIGQRFGVTVALALLAFVFVILIGLPAGMIMAVATQAGRRPRTELGFTMISGLFVAIPEFMLAVSLIIVFGVGLGVLPVAGQGTLAHLVLPVATLVLAPAAYLARIVRVEALAVLDQDYLRTARSKRLPPRLLYLRHALPNMITAALTTSGMMLTGLVAGTVVVETIFAWPGMGSTIVNAIAGKDYPTVQGIVLVYALLVLVINLLVDLLLVIIDPRSTLREA